MSDFGGETIRYYLAVKQLPRIGNTTIISKLQSCGSVQETYESLISQIDSISRKQIDKRVDTLLSLIEGYACEIVTWEDPDYPQPLKHLSDAPPYFFKRGTFHPNDFNGIAIVGTRNYTSYGKTVTEKIVSALALHGVTIISGFMRGIDTVGHLAALENGTRTIAVLGSGFQFPAPPENKHLMAKVEQNGVIMSEFDIDQIPQKYTFPLRNRIVAALSRATVVVEAGEKSGALITARHAGEQGKEVYAVPGSIFSRTSAGTNWLIGNGAYPIITMENLLEQLGLGKQKQSSKKTYIFDNDLQKNIYSRITHERMQVDDLVRAIGTDTASVLQELSIMELRGMVVRGEGERYISY